MTFLPVGVTVRGGTSTLNDEGARPRSLVTDTLIFVPGNTLTQGIRPDRFAHMDTFPGLTIHALRLRSGRNKSHFINRYSLGDTIKSFRIAV